MSTESATPPVIFIDIYKVRPPRIPGRARRQPWRWRAISEGNRKVLASGESYANRADCLAAIELLFGNGSNVFLRRREQDGWPTGTHLGLDNLRWAS